MKNSFVAALCLLALVTMLTTSCEKFRENRQYDSLYDHSAAESSYHDIFRLTMQVLGPGANLIVDPCITKTPVTGGFILTFGDSCTDLYEISRQGSLTITGTGDIYTEGTVVNANPNTLTINGVKVEGALTITTLALNADGKRQFKYVVSNAIVTDADGSNSTWSADRVYTQRDEKEALLIFDDTYTVTGNTSGTDREERFYETVIGEDLVHELICRWPRSGTAAMTNDDLKDRDIVYGEDFCEDNADCCDNNVNVEVDGKREREVKLR
jgi:hypothetical protein